MPQNQSAKVTNKQNLFQTKQINFIRVLFSMASMKIQDPDTHVYDSLIYV